MALPRGSRKTARISVSLDSGDYAILAEVAREKDVSVAWPVRRAVGELVHSHQWGPAQAELPLPKHAASTPGSGSE